jgi:hypothetical protein
MSPSIIDYSSQYYTASYVNGQIQQPQYPSPNYNTKANVAIIVEEAEKLYNTVVKDCINKTVEDLTNKTIGNLASDSKPSSSSLSLLPQKEQSDVRKDSTQKLAAAYTYRKEEEHTFIRSEEIDGHEDDDK